MRRVLCFVVAAVVAAVGGGAAGAGDGPHTPALEFRGQATFPTGLSFMGTQVGGLSGIAYDEARGVYYSLSDDPSQFGPARYYTLAVDLGDGRLDPGDVSFRAVTTLLDGSGLPFATGSLDPEGIASRRATTSSCSPPRASPTRSSRRGCGASRSADGRLGDIAVPGAFLPRARAAASGRTSASRAPPCRRTAAPLHRHRRARSSRTARRPRREREPGAPAALQPRTGTPTASTSTSPTRSPSRRCRRRRSRSTASPSCCR